VMLVKADDTCVHYMSPTQAAWSRLFPDVGLKITAL
jgi:hypothetical protein